MARHPPRAPVAAHLLLLLAGCSGAASERAEPSPTPSPEPTSPPASAPRSLTEREAAALADARTSGPLLAVVREGDVASRRAALWALGRIHDDEAATGLILGLRDVDAEARRAAAFGIGALERDAPPGAVDALLGALAVEGRNAPAAPEAEGPPEVVGGVRATMIWSLARTADPRVAPALEAALADDTECRVGVCRGLAYAGPEGWPEGLLRAALGRTNDASVQVREACWQGLGRVVIPPALIEEASSRAVEALGRPGDTAAEVEARVQAARVLGRLPPSPAGRAALGRSALDAEWRVAVVALRALGLQSSGHESDLAQVLDAVLARSWPPAGSGEGSAGPAAGGPVHVLSTAIEAAQPHARAAPIFERGTAWLARLERSPASRDQAWLACRAAQWVDLGRGWPGRVERCGAEVLDDDTRRVLAAEILARQSGAEPQRVAYLERLFRDGGPRAREAVLAAAGTLALPSALPFASRGLEDPDEGVTIASLELIATLAPAARRVRDDRALAASLSGQAAEPSRFLTELDAPLLAAADRILAGDSLEARVTLASALLTLADPGARPDQAALIEPMRSLAGHPSHGVRSAARAALEALGDPDAAASAVEPVPTPLSTAQLGELPTRARLRTERGDIVLELHGDWAPGTVARFADLARSGFFDGLSFHRVVAGFVAQGGDPRGDGYGGPAWWQRCEDSPLAYERGVVGMALAGRDTGGSQFFIAVGPQHHLEGRYTVFARVVEGMAHADALQVGDPILRVEIEPPPEP